MKPGEVGKAYDQITHLWDNEQFNRNNGIAQHQRAIGWTLQRGKALDVGCGCTGRLTELMLSEGFTPEGVDVSAQMLAIAQQRHPALTFYHADICEWQIPDHYDFITAWDSIWHVPLAQQASVIGKLINSLNPGGVLIFSFGGTDQSGEHSNQAMGPTMYYSTLGTRGFLELITRLGCECRHLEYDQRPELHTYMIVQKPVHVGRDS